MALRGTLLCSAGSFCDCQKLINRDIFKNVDPATNPSDLDAVYLVAVSQPKVKTRTIMALIPTTAMDLIPER